MARPDSQTNRQTEYTNRIQLVSVDWHTSAERELLLLPSSEPASYFSHRFAMFYPYKEMHKYIYKLSI